MCAYYYLTIQFANVFSLFEFFASIQSRGICPKLPVSLVSAIVSHCNQECIVSCICVGFIVSIS